MKFIGRITLLMLVLMVVGLVFRGFLYRSFVGYKSVGNRENYPATNDTLIRTIDAADNQTPPDISQIIRTSLAITSGQLRFTATKNDNDPNKLMASRTAHCVGYAAFFATTCNYLLRKHQLADTWTARPQIGQLYFLGTNVHRYFHSPFFKDHDFVLIENKKTQEVLAVDPTVADYLYIDFVTYNR